MDKHVLAAISVTGIGLDLLGAMYLAYELLGGKHGPLRTLTRMVTYGLLFGLAFGLPLGLGPGLLGGFGLGLTMGQEFAEAARGRLPAPNAYIVLWSAIRSGCFGGAGALLVNWRFGVVFGMLAFGGQLFAYRQGFAPTAGYQPDARPHLRRMQVVGAINRTVGYGLAGAISGLLSRDSTRGIRFGIVSGLSIGIGSVIVSALVPWIEWSIDRMPEKRMGTIGAVLVVTGFVLQSVQYLLVLFGIRVN